MADRRAELERKRAKLNAIREEKERIRKEKEKNSQLKSLVSNSLIILFICNLHLYYNFILKLHLNRFFI
jgi:hypothetical protein